MEITVSHSFGKNLVKVTVLLNKLLKSWFDEIFLRWERISRFSTQCIVWKNGKFTVTEKFFRQINFLVTSLVSRNFCQNKLRVNFHIFLTVEKYYKNCDHDFCGKIIIFFVKSTFLLKSWFHKFFLSMFAFYSTFLHCAQFSNFHTAKYFCEINFPHFFPDTEHLMKLVMLLTWVTRVQSNPYPQTPNLW